MEHTKGKVDWSHRPIDNDENAMYATQLTWLWYKIITI